ncbi:BhlA/UviB family holin-like peptide [Gorillibacterium sp. sgz5001074]|uniref:BhlA/UviB family holin-like peptide n=1 Tax=Gorillibacterium sp. sgz5001074 TaxID=3446695 RepID=UPI003F67FED6
MEEKGIEYFITQGVFCVLFVLLGIWAKGFINRIMEENKSREAALRLTIDKFGDIIKVDIQELKGEVKLLGQERK